MEENKLIDQLLSREYSPQDNPDGAKNEDMSLYGLLDEVTNGRRLMNCLFHSSLQVGRKLNTDKLDGKCRQILRDWTDEEKTKTMNPGVLQMDGPVLFSWSHNSASTSTQETTTTIVQNSTHRESNKLEITTTGQLFDRVSAEINKCIKPNNKDWLVGESVGENEPNGTDSKKSTSSWSNSDFKVDPLQKFVVKELPKPKKKHDNEQAKKSKSKRKSFFGFWGHSGTKPSSKKKSEKPLELKAKPHEDVEEPTQLQDENDTLSDVHTTHSNQECINSQQVEPTESELSVVDDDRGDKDEFSGSKQTPAHINDLLSGEPSIASTPSLSLSSFVPLKPKKKT